MWLHFIKHSRDVPQFCTAVTRVGMQRHTIGRGQKHCAPTFCGPFLVNSCCRCHNVASVWRTAAAAAVFQHPVA